MKKYSITMVFILFSTIIIAQKGTVASIGNYYVFARTAYMFDNYNSVGVWGSIGGLKKIKNKHFIGINLDFKKHLYEGATDFEIRPLLDTKSVKISYHYLVNIWRNKIYWDIGIGAGIMNLSNSKISKVLPTATLINYLDIHLSKRIILELPSLLIFNPANTVNITPNKLFKTQPLYVQYTFFSCGFKYKFY